MMNTSRASTGRRKVFCRLMILSAIMKYSESFVMHKGQTSAIWSQHTNMASSLYVSSSEIDIQNPTTIGTETNVPVDDKTTTLLPLSLDPLLLVSSSPLLNRDESRTLLSYLEMTKDGKSDPLNDVFFEENGEHVFSTAHESKISTSSSSTSSDGALDHDAIYENGRQIIYRVRKEIDRLTNSPSHSGDFALPRFLSFNVESVPDPSQDGVKETLHALLPDGLHSDNVNNMLTRHISALLYLSDDVDDHERGDLVGGATTFPLAVPLDKSDADKSEWDLCLDRAAHRLVEENSLHTGKRNWDGSEEDCTLLESAAYSLFQREISKNAPMGDISLKVNLPSSEMGVRVHPKPGRLCVFHNLLDDGTPDPLALHAGEAILGRRTSNNNNNSPSAPVGKKVLLVFFKTIPSVDPSNPDQDELARRSSESRNWIMDEYC